MTRVSELEQLLTEMEAPDIVRERARTILSHYLALGFATFDLFLSESMSEDGVRAFDSLWLFTAEGAMEGVLTEASDDQIDGARLGDRIVRWNSKSRSYDFAQATADSRLSVELWFTDDLWGEASASGPNCDRLRDVLRRYVTPATGAHEWQDTDAEGSEHQSAEVEVG